MTYHISRAGKIIGTYSYFEVTKFLMDGTFQDTDHYWKQGMTEWSTLSAFNNKERSHTPAPAANPVVAVRPGFIAPKASQPSAQAVSMSVSMQTDKLFGYIGSMLIVVSVFLPFVSILFLNLSLMQGDNGLLFLACGILGLFLTFKNYLKLLLYVGLFPVAVFAELAFRLRGILTQNTPIEGKNVPAEVHDKFGPLAEMLVRASFSFGAGFYALIIGIIILLVVGVGAYSKSKRDSV